MEVAKTIRLWMSTCPYGSQNYEVDPNLDYKEHLKQRKAWNTFMLLLWSDVLHPKMPSLSGMLLLYSELICVISATINKTGAITNEVNKSLAQTLHGYLFGNKRGKSFVTGQVDKAGKNIIGMIDYPSISGKTLLLTIVSSCFKFVL